MKKVVVVAAALSFIAAMPVSAADWESLKEKAKALGDETVVFTKATWNDTEDWRNDAKENVEIWSKDAMEKSAGWIEAGEGKLNDLMEEKDSEGEGNK